MLQTDFTFNANGHVKTKLTKHGEQILNKHALFALPIDTDGYCRMPFWYFMQVFGPHTKLTGEPAFDLDVIFLNGSPLSAEVEQEPHLKIQHLTTQHDALLAEKNRLEKLVTDIADAYKKDDENILDEVLHSITTNEVFDDY